MFVGLCIHSQLTLVVCFSFLYSCFFFNKSEIYLFILKKMHIINIYTVLHRQSNYAEEPETCSMVAEYQRVCSLLELSAETEESTHCTSIDTLADWLSRDSLPKIWDPVSSMLDDTCLEFWQSRMLTTADMVGLRDGEGLVQSRARFNICNASSSEQLVPRLLSTSSSKLPCFCST